MFLTHFERFASSLRASGLRATATKRIDRGNAERWANTLLVLVFGGIGKQSIKIEMSSLAK